MISLIVIIIVSYLAGSIPTSIIMSKLTRGIDIREHGSGNAGGTNAIRVLGWKIGSIVMLIDIFKGVVATIFVSSIRIDAVSIDPEIIKIIAGLSAILGHIWTVFAGFKGGKGVGTAAGMIFSLYPIAATCALVVFTISLFTIRIVSVSSMLAAISLPIVVTILKTVFNLPYSNLLLYFCIFISVLIVFTHRSNIKKLIRGEENKVNFGKKNK